MFPDSQWGAQNAKLCCSTEGLYGQWFQTKNKNRSIRDFEQRIFCRLLGPTYSSPVWYVPMVLSVWIVGPWLVLQAMKPLRCKIFLVEVGHWIWTSETYTPPSPVAVWFSTSWSSHIMWGAPLIAPETTIHPFLPLCLLCHNGLIPPETVCQIIFLPK